MNGCKNRLKEKDSIINGYKKNHWNLPHKKNWNYSKNFNHLISNSFLGKISLRQTNKLILHILTSQARSILSSQSYSKPNNIHILVCKVLNQLQIISFVVHSIKILQIFQIFSSLLSSSNKPMSLNWTNQTLSQLSNKLIKSTYFRTRQSAIKIVSTILMSKTRSRLSNQSLINQILPVKMKKAIIKNLSNKTSIKDFQHLKNSQSSLSNIMIQM